MEFVIWVETRIAGRTADIRQVATVERPAGIKAAEEIGLSLADGLHMSTHASAMLIAALAYSYARKHARNRRFVFGTGKLGDLAGFTSAIILAMIALLIGYEAVTRFMAPVPIHFGEAIPIAVLGLAVNIASAWLLSGGHHQEHSHGHGHGEEAEHAHGEESKEIATPSGALTLSVFEDGVPPVFRIHALTGGQLLPPVGLVSVTTLRPDGARQTFRFLACGGYLESTDSIPEPHMSSRIAPVSRIKP